MVSYDVLPYDEELLPLDIHEIESFTKSNLWKNFEIVLASTQQDSLKIIMDEEVTNTVEIAKARRNILMIEDFMSIPERLLQTIKENIEENKDA